MSTTLVAVSAVFMIFFLCACLACGLYYLAELIEEYTRLTKKLILWTIRVVLVVHVLLLVADRLPLLPCLAVRRRRLVAGPGPSPLPPLPLRDSRAQPTPSPLSLLRNPRTPRRARGLTCSTSASCASSPTSRSSRPTC